MEDILRNLKTAISNVMEKMYFLLPDEEYETVSHSDNGQAIYIGITGNPAYLITLVYDNELAGMMTVDLLGIDSDELNGELIHKCLRETANVVAGNYLFSFGNEGNRNVTLPFDKKSDVFAHYKTTDRGNIDLSFNGRCVSAVLEKIELQ